MSRCGYSDDGDFDEWASIRWRGQVASAIRGKRGRAFLRELLTALDELPIKRLIAEDLIREGEVCAIGSVGIRRGVDLAKLDPDDYDGIAGTFGIARQLVQEIEWVNDEAAGGLTAEKRWNWVRDWVLANLKTVPS